MFIYYNNSPKDVILEKNRELNKEGTKHAMPFCVGIIYSNDTNSMEPELPRC